MMRKQGYYWIKFNDVWYISMYYEEPQLWSIFDLVEYLTDDDLDEIDEKMIVRKVRIKK